MSRYQFEEQELKLIEGSSIPCAVYQFIDKRVVTIALSSAFCEMLHYEPMEEAYRLMDNDMYRDAHPDDVARIADAAFRFATDGGEYNVAFNAQKTAEYKVSGDFSATFRFMNYGNKPVYGLADANKVNNWDNYIVRATAGGATTLLRADAFAMDNAGTFDYDFDWNWDDFAGIMRNAEVVMDVSREKDVVTYSARITAQDGKAYHYKAVNRGASTAEMSLGFTCEKSVVDLLSVSVNSVAGDSTQIQVEDPDSSTTSFAVRNGVETGRGLQDMRGAKVYDVRGRLLGTADSPRVKEMRLRKARQPVFAK
jgi:hypothetical protein